MKEKDLYFSFGFVDKPKTSKEINKLDRKKARQEHDIPVKLIKLNKDLFFTLYATISITSTILVFPQT